MIRANTIVDQPKNPHRVYSHLAVPHDSTLSRATKSKVLGISKLAIGLALQIMISFITILPQANALVKIDINHGSVDPIPLAIVDFEGKSHDATKISVELIDTITNDLESSGLFRIIGGDAFLEKPGFITPPTFAHWRKISATVVVTGTIEVLKSEKMLKVQFKIWDPYAETMIDGMSYKVNQASWRRIAHKISDRIYQGVTGESGYFDSRIVYIAESKDRNNRKIKRLAIMDSDGANTHFLTDGKDLVLTPRFDPKSHKITYLSYKNGLPQVFMLDLQTGIQRLIGNFPGMSFAPRFSPDDNSLIMSVARDGTTSIHEIDLRTQKNRKITGFGRQQVQGFGNPTTINFFCENTS